MSKIVSTQTNYTTGGRLPMPIIRQGSLFGIQDLYDLEPTQRFDAIFSTIDMDSAIFAVSKSLGWVPQRN